MIYCAYLNGVHLKVFEESNIIVNIKIVDRCMGVQNKILEKAILSFCKGNRNAVKYYLDVHENLKIIYRKAQEIPFGKVISYGGLSKAIFGNMHYSRFVGYAMHVNPLPIIIPCHRVVRSNGEVGGFSSGTGNKIKMLEAEGVKITNGRIGSIYFTDL